MSATAPSDKEIFFETAVHDLKNPLHSIVLFISALKQTKDPERIQYLIDRLDRSTRGLDALFKRLLDLSRIDRGKVSPTLSVFDIHTLFQTLEGQFSTIAERSGLKFTVAAPTNCYVYADPVMTIEILINLLSNAFRYTPKGSVSLRGAVLNNRFLIEVCDTGEGIPTDRLEAVFDEFVQGPHAHRKGSVGTQGIGLGLAIVRGLAQSMGTEVKVQSQIGKGSVFSFSLPVSDQLPTIRLNPDLRKKLKGVLVLVVDDDIYALAAMEALLASMGCFVMLARHIDELKVKLDANERFPDILICESKLSNGTSREEILEQCREIIGQDIPSLIVTKYSEAPSPEIEINPLDLDSLEPRRCIIVSKPASSEEILDSLCTLLVPPPKLGLHQAELRA